MRHYRILAIALFVVLLAACSGSGAQTGATLVPTIALQGSPQQAYPGGAPTLVQPPAYPGPGEQPAEQPNPYPGPGPQGVPAIENRSKVTAKLIETAPSESVPEETRLHVTVLTSTDEPGMQNFTRDLVNQEADLVVDTAKLPADLQPGDTFEATVSYKGDESGGVYVIESLSEVAQ